MQLYRVNSVDVDYHERKSRMNGVRRQGHICCDGRALMVEVMIKLDSRCGSVWNADEDHDWAATNSLPCVEGKRTPDLVW